MRQIFTTSDRYRVARSLPPQTVINSLQHIWWGLGVPMRGGISTTLAIYKVYHVDVLSCFCEHKSDEHHVRMYT